MIKTKIYVKGMTCSSCEKKIKENLLKNENINDVQISFKEKKAIVHHNDKISKKEIVLLIKDLGYKVSDNAIKQGLIYGLIPHAGCIGFIIAAIIGATAFTQLFRPMLMSRYFFYILILISFVIATISIIFYLRKNRSLNFDGVKFYKKYIATMYVSTITINILLFLFIFPLTANLTTASVDVEGLDEFNIVVNIPCSGHAPLITNELLFVEGVENVRYSFPFGFRVNYDSSVVDIDEILDIEVFKEYPATLVE